MNQCRICFAPNVTGAVECRNCKAPLKETLRCCQNGHVMDPAWTECNTCRDEGRPLSRDLGSYTPTRFENGGQPPSLPVGRKTVFAPVGVPPRDQATPRATEPEQRRASQKIVAVLVTYTWLPEGQVFPVREGRNRIGSDPSRCDISLPMDDTMSGLHCSISFHTRFVISDRDSMSGTYVNGRPVEEDSYPLENHAEIRTGSTNWRFVVLSPRTLSLELESES